MSKILLLYLIFSVLIFFLPKKLAGYKAIVLMLLQVAVFIYFISLALNTPSGSTVIEEIPWIPGLGLNLVFVADGLSGAFALLITGIGALVFLFAHQYMKKYENTGGFYLQLNLFSGAMLGLVLSGNLVQMFIFWELTTVFSFFLIAFFHEKEESRKAAFQSLFVTGFGGLSLLTGIILLGTVTDSYAVNDWITHADEIRNSQLYLPGLVLIFLGVFTKSAQFPFHFWLPGAMQAPAPVSAYLHSATMVKAGVFLLIRLTPALGGTPEWTYIISLTGVLTMLTGAWFAVTKTDIKSILAYTTISALGILVLLTGINTMLSLKAALVFLFVHAFYKASLFMIAGLIEKKTGTREIENLGGLVRYMPLTFIFATLALFSMAGLPPMLGFLGKELIYEAKVQSPGIASLVLILGVTANILMVTVSLLFLYKVFLGKYKNRGAIPNEKGFLLLSGPAVLGMLSLIIGLFPEFFAKSVIEPALNIIRDEKIVVKLELWHGFNKVFFLSLVTVLSGAGLFLLIIKQEKVITFWRKINTRLFAVNFSDVFTNFLNNFIEFSKQGTKSIQHGYHRYYILTIVLFASALLTLQLMVTSEWKIQAPLSFRPFYISGVVIITALATIFSIISPTRILTIISMGVAGYGIALVYLYYSAPDLAITQILVETLTVVMFFLILQRLPRFAKLSPIRTKIRDAVVSLFFGGIMTMLALKAIKINFSNPVSDYFVENSLSKGYGRNIVNVILVDFRALDTLGEVTVLTVAAFGVFLLLRKKSEP
ncbi:MAG: DUF4040 domain-containing protein [Bacteroidales bacterium]|nr:DUF4040 domain-containing protein [Bacteroidales bacterium]